MDLLLLFAVTATATLKALICKRLGTDGGGTRKLLLTNAVIFLVATAPVLCSALASGGFRLSPYSALMAGIYASVMIFTQLCQITAVRYGTASMTSLIYAAGFLIPIVFSFFAFGEEITPWQGVGVLILMVAVYMIVGPKGGGRLSLLWLLFALLAMLGSGFTAVVQKLHQYSDYAQELPSFLVAAFLMAAFACFLLHFLFRREGGEVGRITLRRAAFPVFSGISIGMLNLMNLMLAGRLPSVIHFPIYNVGSMILTGVLGAILFRERHKPMEIVGFAIGCVAILIIGLL